ncbi:signal peptidase II [Polyangium spumosum]|uniref:Lipoprotein signal peptidase n=1 Tax=Polyangium spumosum TaxID=889282 RepID=A0A6N7PNQ6_9BACT|nr:signal peptidase II [Polyangium spumosum]MRG90541.1 signal peptidase II [Polyangium spumosum]
MTEEKSEELEAAGATGEGAKEPNAEPAEKGGGEALQASKAAPHRSSYVFLAVIATVTLALDLGSKWWAVENLDKPFARVELIKGYLALALAHNRGGAWGLLQNESENVRRPFFVIVSIVAVAFIVSLYRKLTPSQTALKWGLPLVLGGALGNLVDRIRYGHVIDFIDMYIGNGTGLDKLVEKISGPMREYHWPTYNIADIAIVAGVILMGVDMFTARKKDEPPKKAEETSP